MPENKKQTMIVDDGGSRIKAVKMEYPSNTHKEKEEKKTQREDVPERKKLEKVITGSVTTRKKTLGKKFAETFLGDDVESVSSYIIQDVLIPAAKSTISDMVTSGIELLLFGETRGNNRSRKDKGRSGTYVSYGDYYNNRKRDDRRDDRRDYGRTNRARHNFDDIVFDSRGDAEEVRSLLVDMVIDYHSASVYDLYDLVGITGSFTDNKYGWTDLRGATISRARGGGYILELPKPVLLD